jgi:hypothetical protein
MDQISRANSLCLLVPMVSLSDVFQIVVQGFVWNDFDRKFVSRHVR